MSSPNRPLLYNFFVMDTPSHISQGMWTHPENRSTEYNTLDLWVELAQLAEKHHFDSIFFADVLGMYSAPWDVVVSRAVQFPISEPAMLVSALAQATKNLGIVYTSSVLQQHPFTFARQMSTLDHLTKGRVGWNMVSSFNENGFKSMGLDDLVAHDDRYVWLDEYVQVVYKLWEGSWTDSAVQQDRSTGVYTDPRQVRKINHTGKRYSVEGPHLVEPSPQRTPALFQAGASAAGMDFAAANTEGVFMLSGAAEAAAGKIAELKKRIAAKGRSTEGVHFIEGKIFVVGSTEEEAQRKSDELDEYADVVAQMAMVSGAAGIDLTKFDPDEPLVNIIDQAQGMRGAIQMTIDNTPQGKEATIADLGRESARHNRITGTPESIADQIAAFAKVGVTGINIMTLTMPGSYVDFAEHVTPVLKERGLMQREYREGTLREKLFPGQGPRLDGSHPAGTYREHDEYSN